MYRLLVFCILRAITAVNLDERAVINEREQRHQLSSSKCERGEFLCNSSRGCIPGSWVCDGDNDCRDMSDEPATCNDRAPLPCSSVSDLGPSVFGVSGVFRCANGRKCLDDYILCDSFDDCGDNSDESESCKSIQCPHDSVQCPSGRCITTDDYCSENERCYNGTFAPLSPVDCPPLQCDHNKMKCKHGKKCIPLSSVCDGYDNCGDNSDEESCSDRECSEDEIRCNSGRCLKKRSFCNRLDFTTKDFCGDGTNFTGLCDDFTCPEYAIKCDDGLCVYKDSSCDYDARCRDGSDRRHCPELKCTNHGEEKCPGFHKCIYRSWFCDGYYNCPDRSDEDPLLCRNRTCLANEIRCSNGQCIRKDDFCLLGHGQCVDGSISIGDESMCSIRDCERIGYENCPGRNHCIPREYFCDSDDDCGDRSDEETEMCALRTCKGGEVRCDNGQCLDVYSFCSGRYVCRDGSRTHNEHICDGFRQRHSTRPEVNYRVLPYLYTIYGKCLTTLTSKCDSPWVWTLYKKSSPAQWSSKLIAMEMKQICGSVQTWRDCVASDLNEDLQCMELMKRNADLPPLWQLVQAAYNFTCVDNIDVIGREKACLLKFNSWGDSVLESVIYNCNVDENQFSNYHDDSIVFRFCKTAVQLTEEFQQCLTAYVRRHCGDDIATVASLASELAQFARVNVCQQSAQWQLFLFWYWRWS